MQSRRYTSLVSSLVVMLLVCAAASPMILLLIDKAWPADWTRSASIGESYGVASALLSALALIAVAASIAYQSRQLRNQQIQGARDSQFQLLAVVLAEPDVFGPAYSPLYFSMSSEEFRQHVFATLHMRYLEAAFTTGAISGQLLSQQILPTVFSLQQRRGHWKAVRQYWTDTPGDPEAVRRFAALVDDQFNRAANVEKSQTKDQSPST